MSNKQDKLYHRVVCTIISKTGYHTVQVGDLVVVISLFPVKLYLTIKDTVYGCIVDDENRLLYFYEHELEPLGEL
jgi:hypothetical protein